jgi:hypothetical protein
MEENESEGNTERVDISNTLKELLSVVREQKSELSSLKEEVRGSTVSVASEVKEQACFADERLSGVCWRRSSDMYAHCIRISFNIRFLFTDM